MKQRTRNGKSPQKDSLPSVGLEKCWLPICNRLRTRPGRIEPEVYFRIVHATQDDRNSTPVATYCEQTFEIALGLKGAFENGNIGALTRRLTTNGLLSAVPPTRGKA
jgi:hypothetical protein